MIGHLTPWARSPALDDIYTLADPTNGCRSAWIGITMQGAQSVLEAISVLALVTR